MCEMTCNFWILKSIKSKGLTKKKKQDHLDHKRHRKLFFRIEKYVLFSFSVDIVDRTTTSYQFVTKSFIIKHKYAAIKYLNKTQK